MIRCAISNESVSNMHALLSCTCIDINTGTVGGWHSKPTTHLFLINNNLSPLTMHVQRSMFHTTYLPEMINISEMIDISPAKLIFFICLNPNLSPCNINKDMHYFSVLVFWQQILQILQILQISDNKYWQQILQQILHFPESHILYCTTELNLLIPRGYHIAKMISYSWYF